jgi:peptidoglycan/xylan/chitin deacetylase (PgdA/CDA1 family)
MYPCHPFLVGRWLNGKQNISRQLIAAGGRGTFFWNGDNCEPRFCPVKIVLLNERFLDGCIYDEINVKRVKYAYAQGNMVASHTWDHKDLTKLTFDQIHDELYRVELAFERLLGVTPAFMRPPYGNYNNLVRQVAAQRGQKLVLWDFDSGDSTGSTPAQSDKAYDALIKKHPGTILPLNHEVYSMFFSFRFLFFCYGLRYVRLLNIMSWYVQRILQRLFSRMLSKHLKKQVTSS